MAKPWVGAIVHYVLPADGATPYPLTHRPAIVIEVVMPTKILGLKVFTSSRDGARWTPLAFRANVAEDQSGTTGDTWHWPEGHIPQDQN